VIGTRPQHSPSSFPLVRRTTRTGVGLGSFSGNRMKKPHQSSLFENDALLPEGFKYQAELISAEEEQELVRNVEALPFKDFEFQGFLGKRRVVSFGWRYDFNDRELQTADDIPPFLLPLRQRAAAFAGLTPADFPHVLVTEYGPGAAIGWHRDKAVFGEVVGISLLSPCRFRLRRKRAGKWERISIIAEPRSAYLLAGPARTEWEHSIPPLDRLRYSITFRNFVEKTLAQ
jgi:alkylated DNA repair dioxygenase AlkB